MRERLLMAIDEYINDIDPNSPIICEFFPLSTSRNNNKVNFIKFY